MKLKLTTFLGSSLALFSFLNATEPTTLIEQQEEALVKGIIPSTKIDKVERAEIDGFYKAYLGNGNIFYINPFKRVLFIGELYTATGESLTANDASKWQAELNEKALKDANATELLQNAKRVVYGSGSKRYDFVIFTDPECPFCAKVEEFFEKQNVNVYVNFFPLSFHQNAKKWSGQILSSKDIKLAMKQIRTTQKNLNDVSISKEAENTLKATIALGEKLNITGTPKLFVIDKIEQNKVVAVIDGANFERINEFLVKDKE
ncbi:DsbC family protein [Campylobacter sp. MIT 97-5078]|uniref:DsbC family protein n=1 Tax=Campylobacter sp. MIT 97-5078 TaxID=1548153 RepID=UPI00051411D9|nr:DsbC family protein [Campylobacter sp. MIT 97-5078]KGI56039.1 thiol [Campylobacter sp. MIT 97-5078]KGI57469.1 thiol [Campylobacter sp. MIT 97-5078]KGI57502.1 thiol [Campylobacter sp. MIT 97-5078]TQR27393.1 DsbC family protein [Campylobacter sp. MIT 97-5078]